MRRITGPHLYCKGNGGELLTIGDCRLTIAPIGNRQLSINTIVNLQSSIDNARPPHRDPEWPAAHVSVCLALLPSGPDAVRRLKLHRFRAAVRRTIVISLSQVRHARLQCQSNSEPVEVSFLSPRRQMCAVAATNPCASMHTTSTSRFTLKSTRPINGVSIAGARRVWQSILLSRGRSLEGGL